MNCYFLSRLSRLLVYGLIIGISLSCRNALPDTPAESRLQGPDQTYGALFHDVQMAQVFPDSKTFADCTPRTTPDSILAAYARQKEVPDFDLTSFVQTYFDPPHAYASGFQTDTSRSIGAHIEALWPALTRSPDATQAGTLIPLPNRYIVPGGRFGEVYYWDSYFTMLGLQVSETASDMVRPMVDNFAYLIERQGFIPNGNRSYYLSRSQPPFFAMMVQLLHQMDSSLLQYQAALEGEYAFWMRGKDSLSEARTAVQHVVRMPDGALLNRYWDAHPQPRPESYREDVLLARESDRPAQELYRDLRSACESGWDFSSRWFADPQQLASIRTTAIIPVDLNALLYNLENTLSHLYQQSGASARSEAMANQASQRKAAIQRYLWSDSLARFGDYDWKAARMTPVPSLAMAYPLVFELATEDQAASVATWLERDFLHQGGLVSTLHRNGQQWDAPNGWAPLQWMSIKGLRNYEHHDLADEVARRWMALNQRVYQESGKLVEKYNVMDQGLEAGGGEYPLQDGFGWTNGVMLRLLQER